MGQSRGFYRDLVGELEEKRALRKPRCRWGDNIEMDIQEVGFGRLDWIDLAQYRDRWRAVVNAVMHFRVP